MDKLIAELQRLYFLPGQRWFRNADADGIPPGVGEGPLPRETMAAILAGEASLSLDLLGPAGTVRTMVVEFARAADWEQAAGLYRGVQADLDLPAPAISVSGQGGYGLWFSLADPVPAALARAFLEALCRRYLAGLHAHRFALHPGGGHAAEGAADTVELAPALLGANGKWSAFIDPSLGGMFIDEPWLEMAPNPHKQADLLAGFASIKAGDFQRVLHLLQSAAEPSGSPAAGRPDAQAEAAAGPGSHGGDPTATLHVGSNFSDPKSFLLAVMNDAAASPNLRVEAAKALLPYFEATAGKRQG